MRDVRNAALIKDSIDDVRSSKKRLETIYGEFKAALERFDVKITLIKKGSFGNNPHLRNL